MRFAKWFIPIAFAAAAVLCAGLWRIHRAHAGVPSPEMQQRVQVSPLQQSEAPGVTLFPELSRMQITSVSLSTPERSFQFYLDKHGAVSVNGQQADGEIFSTLLEQIAELPVEQHSPFSPQPQDLILTLIVSSGARQHVASFYEGGGAGEYARIVLGSGESREYRRTSGWRVGTLMMTCEGTRIQDIHGNETPSTQHAVSIP